MTRARQKNQFCRVKSCPKVNRLPAWGLEGSLSPPIQAACALSERIGDAICAFKRMLNRLLGKAPSSCEILLWCDMRLHMHCVRTKSPIL